LAPLQLVPVFWIGSLTVAAMPVVQSASNNHAIVIGMPIPPFHEPDIDA
jgi:hypothetical protein